MYAVFTEGFTLFWDIIDKKYYLQLKECLYPSSPISTQFIYSPLEELHASLSYMPSIPVLCDHPQLMTIQWQNESNDRRIYSYLIPHLIIYPYCACSQCFLPSIMDKIKEIHLFSSENWKKAVALWHTNLSCYLKCYHSIWAVVQVLASPRKWFCRMVEDGSSTCPLHPCSHVGDPGKAPG